ncbi:sensor domain-containing diguanylate cyclase [Vibrio atypicus]|uniref:sensor domain-containing diguanylate cyclase n=1 Tax=Vibrio atypicus TaxID=558271 RepID=UPI0013576ECD|nr:GGDEF domain-containing protein [Vibrio atypicus]
MIELECIEDIYNHDHFTLHEVVLNEIGSFVFVKSRDGMYLYANQLTLELFNTTLENLKGKTDYDFFESELLSDILHSDRMVYETGQTVINEERTRAIPDGRLRIYRAIKKPIVQTESKEVIGLIGVSTDITDMVHMREKLAELANTDELSKLCNRRKLWQHFSSAYQAATEHQLPLSCIVIDIDHFKQINDRYGHDFGDKVIVELADIIRDNLTSEDCCGRIGGEEFLIVLDNTDIQGAYKIAEQLRMDFLTSPLNNLKSPFSISCGVTQITNRDHDFFALYRRADKALYEAKNRGRNQCAQQ